MAMPDQATHDRGMSHRDGTAQQERTEGLADAQPQVELVILVTVCPVMQLPLDLELAITPSSDNSGCVTKHAVLPITQHLSHAD